MTKSKFWNPNLPTAEELSSLMERENKFERSKLDQYKVSKLLDVDLSFGLRKDEVTRRVEQYGFNYVQRQEPETFLEVLWNNANDKVIILIGIAGVLAMGVDALEGEEYFWVEGTLTLGTVSMVVLFSSVFEYIRERRFINLIQKVDDYRVVAVRDGEQKSINAQGVCVGDLIYLETGDVPPGDGLMVRGEALDLDESTLTGETEYIEKTVKDDNAIYGGTTVAGGSGHMVVLCVGSHSVLGQVSQMMDEEDQDQEKAGLDARLEDMAESIGYYSIMTAGLFFLFVVLEYFFVIGVGWKDEDGGDDIVRQVFNLLVAALLLLILGIPEGLPVAISLTLVLGAKKMEEENVLVKKPKKGEMMGAVTTICTDKTGTLTTGNMTVQAAMFDEVMETDLRKFAHSLNQELSGHLSLGVAVNSSGRVGTRSCPLPATQETGNSTERAMLRLLDSHFNVDFNQARQDHPPLWTAPFSSTRKVSSVVVSVGSKRVVYCKGAPEVVLGLCSVVVNAKGEESRLGATRVQETLTAIAEEGMRALALAYRYLPDSWSAASAPRPDPLLAGAPEGTPEGSLCLLAVLLIKDPVRADVPLALQQAKDAGVNVIMVTGDAVTTATSVALECGLLHPEFPPHAVMEGPTFRRLVKGSSRADEIEDIKDDFNQTAFDRIWPELHVLARSSPIDKFLLVKGLMQSTLYQNDPPRRDIHPDKQIVAVTGDGVNDIAAMNRANVGVAMGGGQQAAVEVAEVVLTDDNFSSCVMGIKWGRNIREAACKFIQFQITVTAVFVMFLIVQVVIWMHTDPLTLIQALWLALVQDTLGAMALASDAASEDLLKRRPVREDEPLVSPIMKRNIIGQALYQTLALVVVGRMAEDIFSNDDDSDDSNDFVDTVTFHLIVLQTLANQFCMRKVYGEYNFLSGLQNNPWFVGVSSIEFCLQLILGSSSGFFVPISLNWETMMGIVIISFVGVWSFHIALNAGYWYYTTGKFTPKEYDARNVRSKPNMPLMYKSNPYGTFSVDEQVEFENVLDFHNA